jgi:PAS domain S-box-containing protein
MAAAGGEQAPGSMSSDSRCRDLRPAETGVARQIVCVRARPGGGTMAQRLRGRRRGIARDLRTSELTQRDPRTLTPAEAEAFISRFAPDFISVHASDGHWLYASANVREMFGWEPRQLLGRSATEVLHPEDLGRLQLGHGLRRGDREGRVRHRLRCADGTWRWVETRSRAEISEGKVGRIVWLTREIPDERPRGGAHAGGEDRFLQGVRSAVAQLGFTKSATAASVAREMGVSLRTLQRRLQRMSWSVSRARDDVFRRIAEGMLREEGTSVDEVVARLGFSSRSAFHRAFRRWTGLTPGAFRAPPPKTSSRA